MKKCVRTLIMAILSGIAIGVGGTVYLTMENKIMGALMFTVGLYTICIQGLDLFTGKVGYFVEEFTVSYFCKLIIIWIGNFIGTFIVACCIQQTRAVVIMDTAKAVCEIKLADTYPSLFILGIFCGILMFIAVDGYKKTDKNPVILFMGVATFIYCGFEHCIADMFYFSMAGLWSVKALWSILVITMGNAVGGMLLPFAAHVVKE